MSEEKSMNVRRDLLQAFEAAVERMEAVANGIPIENRSRGVSPGTHVRHMAGHLEQHAKIARAEIDKARTKLSSVFEQKTKVS